MSKEHELLVAAAQLAVDMVRFRGMYDDVVRERDKYREALDKIAAHPAEFIHGGAPYDKANFCQYIAKRAIYGETP